MFPIDLRACRHSKTIFGQCLAATLWSVRCLSDSMQHSYGETRTAGLSQAHLHVLLRPSTWRPSTLPLRLKSFSSYVSNCRHTHAVVCAGRQWETGCKLVGCGSSAPDAVLTNKDLEKLVETDDEWIATRTGIRKRHILGTDETLSDHAAKSAQRALDMAGIGAEEVDLIILATSSPDDLFGSACRVCTLLYAPSVVPADFVPWSLYRV